jgi:predicted RNase H-like HicB family nuclease
MKFNIQITKINEDLFIANCPELPGCFVQAFSERQALNRIHDAIKLVITSLKKHFEKLPFEN